MRTLLHQAIMTIPIQTISQWQQRECFSLPPLYVRYKPIHCHPYNDDFMAVTAAHHYMDVILSTFVYITFFSAHDEACRRFCAGNVSSANPLYHCFLLPPETSLLREWMACPRNRDNSGRRRHREAICHNPDNILHRTCHNKRSFLRTLGIASCRHTTNLFC